MKLGRRSLLGAASATALGSAAVLEGILANPAQAATTKAEDKYGLIVNTWIVDVTFETGQFKGQTKQSVYTFHIDLSLAVILPDNRATTRLGKWTYDFAKDVYRTTAREITFQGTQSGYITVQETITVKNGVLTGYGQGILNVPGLPPFSPNKFLLKGTPLQIIPL